MPCVELHTGRNTQTANNVDKRIQFFLHFNPFFVHIKYTPNTAYIWRCVGLSIRSLHLMGTSSGAGINMKVGAHFRRRKKMFLVPSVTLPPGGAPHTRRHHDYITAHAFYLDTLINRICIYLSCGRPMPNAVIKVLTDE